MTSSVIYYSTDARKNEIYSLNSIPDGGRGFEQSAEQRSFDKIVYYMPLMLTPPPTWSFFKGFP